MANLVSLLAIPASQRQLAEEGLRLGKIHLEILRSGWWSTAKPGEIGRMDWATGHLEDLVFTPPGRAGAMREAKIDLTQLQAWIAAEPEREAARARKEAERAMLRATMCNSLPGSEDKEPGGTVPGKRQGRLAPAKVRDWYVERVQALKAAGKNSTQAEDEKAAEQEFGSGTRDHVRQLRREYAPTEWQKKGRKPSELSQVIPPEKIRG